MTEKTVRDVDVAGKRVLVRVDFNVPLADGRVADAAHPAGAPQDGDDAGQLRSGSSSWRTRRKGSA